MGSFGVDLMYFLDCSNVVFDFSLFLNLPKQKVPHGCPKWVGGRGEKPLLENFHMGGISQDVKRLKMRIFLHLFFVFSRPFTFLLL